MSKRPYLGVVETQTPAVERQATPDILSSGRVYCFYLLKFELRTTPIPEELPSQDMSQEREIFMRRELPYTQGLKGVNII